MKFKNESCNSCSGGGKVPCPGCSGSGTVLSKHDDKPLTVCNGCNGSGKMTCRQCNGAGKY